MALVNIETALRTIVATLEKSTPPGGVTVLSYKRNRGIDILRWENDRVWVREHGYGEGEQETTLDALPRLLKPLLKYEFPRSRKVRLYRLSGPEELDRPRKTL